MKACVYLNYGGDCRQAFEFYQEHLGGMVTMVTTHGEQPDPSKVAPEMMDKVLHARMELGGMTLMGADMPPGRHQPMRSAYLTLLLDSSEQADRVYALLSEGGEIFMKMEKENF